MSKAHLHRIQRQFSDRGFTLIELLVVVAIIGILASVVLASLSTAREKARDSARMAQIEEMQKALSIYYIKNNAFPASGWTCSYEAGWQTGTLATALKPYMPALPTDPLNDSVRAYSGGHSYCYYSNGYDVPGSWYMLVYTLEHQNMELDTQTGVTACDGTQFNYRDNDGYVITVGGNCP